MSGSRSSSECLLYLAETVCRLLPVASCKTQSFQPKISSARTCATSWGGSPSSRKSILGRAFKEDEFSTRTSSDRRSLNREKLIALFNRIQTEISQGKSGSAVDGHSSHTSIDDESSVETSVLEFLQQSNKTKVESSRLKRSEESNHKRKTMRKENSVPALQPLSSINFTRPPSKFVKRSPIPSPTPLRSNEIEPSYVEESSSATDKESSKIEGMKLSELKELAKDRGMRGYSKLKKSELVQLLKS